MSVMDATCCQTADLIATASGAAGASSQPLPLANQTPNAARFCYVYIANQLSSAIEPSGKIENVFRCNPTRLVVVLLQSVYRNRSHVAGCLNAGSRKLFMNRIDEV